MNRTDCSSVRCNLSNAEPRILIHQNIVKVAGRNQRRPRCWTWQLGAQLASQGVRPQVAELSGIGPDIGFRHHADFDEALAVLFACVQV